MNNNDRKEFRFICDDNLGKLARYLRAGGFDTLFYKTIDNSRLIRLSLDEERYILTRDRKLTERRLVRYYFLIEDDYWPDQLRSVVERFGLIFRQSRLFSRCLEDNTPIIPVDKEAVRDLVYPFTFQNHTDFKRCPLCGRVYWSGTHVKAMLNRLRQAGIEVIEDR